MTATKQAMIVREHPYSWQYALWYGQPRFIRHWVRLAPKTEHWLEQVNREIAALTYALSQRGYEVKLV